MKMKTLNGLAVIAVLLSSSLAWADDFLFMNSPSRPPEGSVRPVVIRPDQLRGEPMMKTMDASTVYEMLPEDAVVLDVPTSTWTYGCTPTAVGMIMAYYDRIGYMNIYTGPCNGGLAPMTNVGQGDNPKNPIPGSCSLIASMQGFDGKVGRGHVDDYWISYLASGPDPYQINGWTEHEPDCIADYLGTSMSKHYARDGETKGDIENGVRAFITSRGYTANVKHWTWYFGGWYGGYMFFGMFMDEIDAGRPVVLSLASSDPYIYHAVAGVGYHEATQTIYLHDTWDNELHSMNLHGYYADEYYLKNGGIFNLTISFTPVTTGSLTVEGFDPNAIDAGAQWRLMGGPDIKWKQSGEIIPYIPVGSGYTLEFKPLPGWEIPEPNAVTIAEGDNTISGPFYIWTGGTGTIDNPYVISSKAEFLDWFTTGQYYYNAHFILTEDIDLTGEVFTSAIIAPYVNGVGQPFTGTFNGNGHIISNLTIDTLSDGNAGNGNNSYLGLFGQLGEGARVYDLGLDHVIITCGSGSKNVGGLCGDNHGTIERCYADILITNGGSNVGGLCGYANGGSFINCYSRGQLTNTPDTTGGLCGDAINSTFAFCYSNVAIENQNAGGLLSSQENTYTSSVSPCFDVYANRPTSCYWNVSTSGITMSGIGAGRTDSQMKDVNTYVGWGTNWKIDNGNNYPHLAWEDVNSDLIQCPEQTYAGSGCKSDPFVIREPNDLFVLAKRPMDWSSFIVLGNDIDMTNISHFPTIGCFSGHFDGQGFDIQNLNMVYPAQSYSGLFGCLENAVVENVNIINLSLNGYRFIGGLCGVSYSTVIKNCTVQGSIISSEQSLCVGGLSGASFGDGRIDKCKSNVSISSAPGSWYVGGMLGCNLGTSYVSNCFASVHIFNENGARGFNIGGFCGGNIEYGILENCFSQGTVTGMNAYNVGGLCGYNGLFSQKTINPQYSTIKYCGSSVNVNANYSVGGLIGVQGSSNAKTVNSFSTGSVSSGGDWIGGFCGGSLGIIRHCFSTGQVNSSSSNKYGFNYCMEGVNENCFWDTQTSGMTTSLGGTGKTTAQMKDINTFLNANWDYVNETANGKMDLWYQPANSYPKLFWQAPSGDGNYDEQVDLADIAVFGQWWLTTQDDLPADERLYCDYDFNGSVNLADFSLLAENWLNPE